MKLTVAVISCEHAVDTIPETYRHLFSTNKTILESPKAYDFGALGIAEHLQQQLQCELIKTQVSPLLIDCNRSVVHHHCFSSFSRDVSHEDKQHLIEQYYEPYRDKAMTIIKKEIENNHQVLHLSIHSFEPSQEGAKLSTGIGISYDPTRHGEKEVARIWRSLLKQQRPAYRVRLNYPIRGKEDNFSSTLRKCYSEHDYLGLEIACNQSLLYDETSRHAVTQALCNSLVELLEIL